mmetsp:Transcript_33539/g.81067  ORF Transcript_33539/g.81067 Transcript_33539/m.81067 type:complete len:201 (-) Transcript_33539:1275-1877(-)
MLFLGFFSLSDKLLLLTLQTTYSGALVVSAATVFQHELLISSVVFLLDGLGFSLQTCEVAGDDFQESKNTCTGRLLSVVPTASRRRLVVKLLQHTQGLGDSCLRLLGVGNSSFVFFVLRVSLLGCHLHRLLDIRHLRLQLRDLLLLLLNVGTKLVDLRIQLLDFGCFLLPSDLVGTKLLVAPPVMLRLFRRLLLQLVNQI